MAFTGHVRVNITHEARIIGLVETGAVVKLWAPLPVDRQTILTLEGSDGDTVHVASRVVRAFVRAGGERGPEYYIALEFLSPLPALSCLTAAPQSIRVAHA